MDGKNIFVILFALYNYATVLCTDIEDCERCSTKNFFLDNISTESTAKRCWILRTHFIRYCDMCLRRCCASEANIQNKNPVCASSEPDWYKYERGRRIFYNDCAFFRFICEVEQPSRTLTWKCMFRRPWEHDDCDASSSLFENGRRKPGLYEEKSPPRINCAKYSYLPQLEPCPSRGVATPAPPPSTTPPPLPTTTIAPLPDTSLPSTSYPDPTTKLITRSIQDSASQTTSELKTPAIATTSPLPYALPITTATPTTAFVSARPTKNSLGRVPTPVSKDAPTTGKEHKTPSFTSSMPEITTLPSVISKRTAQSIHSDRTISLIGTDYSGTAIVPDATEAAISLQSTFQSYDGKEPSATMQSLTLKGISTANSEGNENPSVPSVPSFPVRRTTITPDMPEGAITKSKEPAVSHTSRYATTEEMHSRIHSSLPGIVISPKPTLADMPSCSCRNSSLCTQTVRSKDLSSICPGRFVIDIYREKCKSCQPPPVFPVCSFPQLGPSLIE